MSQTENGATRGHLVLLIPVSPLEEWVRQRTAFYDESFISADAAFAHAHVTILVPFPENGGAVFEHLVHTTAPFDYELDRLAVFPDGIIHLLPRETAPFEQMMREARMMLPEVVPYWGRVDDPPPHVTLDMAGQGGVTLESTAASIPEMPIRGRARELQLTWWESSNCKVLRRAPLTGT